MMKNYDTEREKLDGIVREFTLGGVTFQAMAAMPGEALSDLADVQKNPEKEGSWGIVAEAIRRTLLPDQREGWDEVLAKDLNPPITFALLMRVAGDLLEEATGRPPVPATSSGNTDVNTPTRSTDGFVTVARPAGTP